MSRRTFLQSAIALLPLPFVAQSPLATFASGEVMILHGKNKLFCVNHKLVRKEYADGTTKWYLDGVIHREDGPAVVNTIDDFYKREWWIHGKRHRADGPAVEFSSGTKEWWVNGELHRADGPAVEREDGSKEWWVDGKRHRTDGPAVEDADDYKEWHVKGKLHRIEEKVVNHV